MKRRQIHTDAPLVLRCSARDTLIIETPQTCRPKDVERAEKEFADWFGCRVLIFTGGSRLAGLVKSENVE